MQNHTVVPEPQDPLSIALRLFEKAVASCELLHRAYVGGIEDIQAAHTSLVTMVETTRGTPVMTSAQTPPEPATTQTQTPGKTPRKQSTLPPVAIIREQAATVGVDITDLLPPTGRKPSDANKTLALKRIQDNLGNQMPPVPTVTPPVPSETPTPENAPQTTPDTPKGKTKNPPKDGLPTVPELHAMAQTAGVDISDLLPKGARGRPNVEKKQAALNRIQTAPTNPA